MKAAVAAAKRTGVHARKWAAAFASARRATRGAHFFSPTAAAPSTGTTLLHATIAIHASCPEWRRDGPTSCATGKVRRSCNSRRLAASQESKSKCKTTDGRADHTLGQWALNTRVRMDETTRREGTGKALGHGQEHHGCGPIGGGGGATSS